MLELHRGSYQNITLSVCFASRKASATTIKVEHASCLGAAMRPVGATHIQAAAPGAHRHVIVFPARKQTLLRYLYVTFVGSRSQGAGERAVRQEMVHFSLQGERQAPVVGHTAHPSSSRVDTHGPGTSKKSARAHIVRSRPGQPLLSVPSTLCRKSGAAQYTNNVPNRETLPTRPCTNVLSCSAATAAEETRAPAAGYTMQFARRSAAGLKSQTANAKHALAAQRVAAKPQPADAGPPASAALNTQESSAQEAAAAPGQPATDSARSVPSTDIVKSHPPLQHRPVPPAPPLPRRASAAASQPPHMPLPPPLLARAAATGAPSAPPPLPPPLPKQSLNKPGAASAPPPPPLPSSLRNLAKHSDAQRSTQSEAQRSTALAVANPGSNPTGSNAIGSAQQQQRQQQVDLAAAQGTAVKVSAAVGGADLEHCPSKRTVRLFWKKQALAGPASGTVWQGAHADAVRNVLDIFLRILGPCWGYQPRFVGLLVCWAHWDMVVVSTGCCHAPAQILKSLGTEAQEHT